VNIHVNRYTRLQSWQGKTIFGDYPLHLRPGNFTVTLLFHDAQSVRRVYEMLGELLADIESAPLVPSWPSPPEEPGAAAKPARA